MYMYIIYIYTYIRTHTHTHAHTRTHTRSAPPTPPPSPYVPPQVRRQISGARDERALLLLMPRLGGPQLCEALARLSSLVRDCPDPEAWAASLTAGPDFNATLRRVKDVLPELDHVQLRDSLCALAELNVREPWVLLLYCERIASLLHVLTVADTARCLWAFCAMGLAQAPTYGKMMRAVEKQVRALPAEVLCRLIRAIVPLGRAAACARLLPKLAGSLALAQPLPPLRELLSTCRALASRIPLPALLLIEVHQIVTAEVSGEGDPESLSLAGSLEPAQIATALWIFVRHLPVVSRHIYVLYIYIYIYIYIPVST